MKYEILTRRVTLLIYGKDSNNYSSTCQININGNRGTIDTLVGGDLYKFLQINGFDVFKNLGLTEVYACMTPSHIRLLKRYLNKILDIDVSSNIFKNGLVDVQWVKMTEKI